MRVKGLVMKCMIHTFPGIFTLPLAYLGIEIVQFTKFNVSKSENKLVLESKYYFMCIFDRLRISCFRVVHCYYFRGSRAVYSPIFV